MSRRLHALWPWRWLRALRGLVHGVRLHPSAALVGATTAFALARGTRVGARTRLDVGAAGRCVVGQDVWISSDVEIQTDTEVHIGDGTTVQRRCTVNGSTRVGRGCIFAPNVFVSSGTHPFRALPALPIREQERRLAAEPGAAGATLDRPIWIQDDCWLGVNAVVCPGVTIGKGSVVGANSVVTKNIRPYSVVAGSPARAIGTRLDWAPPAVVDANDPAHAVYLLGGNCVAGPTAGARFFEVVAGEPLRVALAAPAAAATVQVHYRAETSLSINCTGREIALPAGEAVVELPCLDTEWPGVVYCDVALAASSAGALLHIHRLAALPADSSEG